MELHQIRYFLALCETLNFARAAERCAVSQPSLSRAIKKMEYELGGALIRREGRLTHLTELGRLLSPMMQQVMLHAEGTKSAARHFLSEERPLRLGILSSIGPRRLARFLTGFGSAHPDFAFSIIDGDSALLKERLLNGNLDAAVMSLSADGGTRLRGQRLYCEPAVVVFPRGHRLERLDAVLLKDLRGERFLWREGCELHDHLLTQCRRAGFDLCIACRSERDDWIQAMVAAGHGITIALADAHLGNDTVALPLSNAELARDIELVTVIGRPLDAGMQRALRALHAYKWDKERPSHAASAAAPSERLSMVAENLL